MAKDSDQQPLHTEGKNGPDRPPKRKCCTGYCCYKAMVVIYSLIFLLIGICLLSIGIWLAKVKGAFESINDALTAPVILAVVLGLFMIIFAFLGVIGAIREKLMLLKIFLGIAIVVFLGQVIIGILAFIYREEALTVVNKQLRFAIEEYENDDDVKKAVDHIQQKFTCCGLSNPSDWNKNEFYACGNPAENKSCGVPDSCCKRQQLDCGLDARNPNATEPVAPIFKKGCTSKFKGWVEVNLDIVGATALGLALFHVLGIFLVYFFITAVQDRVWLFKYRKRFYNN